MGEISMLSVFSYGGGVQSTAALVLAAQGKIDYHLFLFCNVGEDSENPKTIAYVNEIAKPFAQQHGLSLLELQKRRRDGTPETIYQRLTKPGSRSIGIPVRMSNGAPGNRSCTVDFKIKVCDKWLLDHGVRDALLLEKRLAAWLEARHESAIPLSLVPHLAAFPRPLARVGLGISLDEFQRMRSSDLEWKQNAYPLIDLRLTRQDCMNIIERAGLPIPPKSSCKWCPFHRLSYWIAMRRDDPTMFAECVTLERFINERRGSLGLDAVWLTRYGKPLDKVVSDTLQPALWEEDDMCESGYCMV
jgi:hypothetical protein